MGVLLALAAAMSFGSGDFLGGRASASGSPTRVVALAQLSAALGALVLLVFVRANAGATDLGYGAAAGASNVVGLAFLYRGLARARMGVVAPVTAVVAALVPITWGLLTGERPSAVAATGVVMAVVAAAFVAQEHEADPHGRRTTALLYAVPGGVFLGTSLVWFAQTAASSGVWPIVAARWVAAALAGGAMLVVARASPRLPAVPRRFAVVAGVLDVVATGLLVAALRSDLTVLVAPVTALAPAFTVVLAWLVLKEEIARVQLVGVVVALAGLVLIASG